MKYRLKRNSEHNRSDRAQDKFDNEVYDEDNADGNVEALRLKITQRSVFKACAVNGHAAVENRT